MLLTGAQRAAVHRQNDECPKAVKWLKTALFRIIENRKGTVFMAKYTPEELNNFNKEQLISLFCTMQEQLEQVNRNLEKLIEEVRLADQNRFGRKTEKLDQIVGQLDLFNEAEAGADPNIPEPSEDEVLISVITKKKSIKANATKTVRIFQEKNIIILCRMNNLMSSLAKAAGDG